MSELFSEMELTEKWIIEMRNHPKYKKIWTEDDELFWMEFVERRSSGVGMVDVINEGLFRFDSDYSEDLKSSIFYWIMGYPIFAIALKYQDLYSFNFPNWMYVVFGIAGGGTLILSNYYRNYDFLQENYNAMRDINDFNRRLNYFEFFRREMGMESPDLLWERYHSSLGHLIRRYYDFRVDTELL